MSFARARVGILALAALGLATTGCLRKQLLDGQIQGTLEGSTAVNTLQDYDIARVVANSGMGQLEGLHNVAPWNTTALFMLTRGWSGVAFGFMEDDYEAAYEKDDEVMAEYHLARARAAYRRAIYYGVELMGHHTEGFDRAKGSAPTLRAWLVENYDDPEHAEELLWIGFAHIGLVSAGRDKPEIVAELYVGEEIVKRSVELDEKLQYGLGHVILGSFHARHAMTELDESKKHFERALQINGGKFLSTQLNMAKTYYCVTGNKPMYEQRLNEVLAAGDLLPEARLQNTIAKRRARRYLNNKIWQEECGFAG